MNTQKIKRYKEKHRRQKCILHSKHESETATASRKTASHCESIFEVMMRTYDSLCTHTVSECRPTHCA